MEDLSEPNEATPLPKNTISEGWQEIPPALPAVGILAGLSDRSLINLATYGQFEQLAAGINLITEGDVQDRFYIVVSGKLAISAFAGGKEVPLSVAEAGECIGEVSLLEPGPASASVQVREDAILWSMNLDNLRLYLSEHAGGGGSLLMGMAQCLSQRIRQTNQLIGYHHVVPAETLPHGRERAITADNTPINLGFFDKLKRSLSSERKVRISTEIKL
jgi:CRP-like cAMP-binding protein